MIPSAKSSSTRTKSPCVHNLNAASLIHIKGSWEAVRKNGSVRTRRQLIFKHTHDARKRSE